MSEPAKINKFIYETTVKKVVQVVKKETTVKDGKTIETSTPIKSIKDIKVAILKPDRRRFKEADIFYAKALSKYLKEGLLPTSLVQKRYANDGGPLSENEKNAVNAMREKYAELQTEYFSMKEPLSDENKTRRAEIMLEMNSIANTLRDIQSAYSSLFENTADAKAKSDVIEWWIVQISYIDEDETGYKSLYGEGDFESRMKTLETLETKEDDFTNEVIKKLSYFISFWFTIGNRYNAEDFKSAEENYQENITEYLKPKELDEQPKKEESLSITPTPLSTPEVAPVDSV